MTSSQFGRMDFLKKSVQNVMICHFDFIWFCLGLGNHQMKLCHSLKVRCNKRCDRKFDLNFHCRVIVNRKWWLCSNHPIFWDHFVIQAVAWAIVPSSYCVCISFTASPGNVINNWWWYCHFCIALYNPYWKWCNWTKRHPKMLLWFHQYHFLWNILIMYQCTI